MRLGLGPGMVIGMATNKITITLEADQLAEVRELVAAGRVANVSAFVKHAVKVALSDAAGWKEMLDEALAETGGPLTDAEREWADSILTGSLVRDGGGKSSVPAGSTQSKGKAA